MARVTKRLFAPRMGLVIRARYAVVAGLRLLLSPSAASVIRGDVPWQFCTAPESGSIMGDFAFLPGAIPAAGCAPPTIGLPALLAVNLAIFGPWGESIAATLPTGLPGTATQVLLSLLAAVAIIVATAASIAQRRQTGRP